LDPWSSPTTTSATRAVSPNARPRGTALTPAEPPTAVT
jgi:hypothetical protein